MITAATPVFPNNAVELIATRSQSLDTDLFVVKRPLRESDPAQSVGVFGSQWNPTEDSYEMTGYQPSIHEPTLSAYLIGVQAFVKDMDELNGLATHSVLSKMIRVMLYRDDSLRVGLRSLSVVMNGSTERTQRFGIRTQRYLSNDLQGVWLYLSTLEFWLETETV
jgi:hypothetical protein